ncbi:hypothetical protein GGI08_000692 [Coemansia sp. S2]|nr:hypothetical protein GGI08_000692 [Coemansia sp. S2]
MSFAGLPAITQLRQVRRTVLQWVGKMISAVDDLNNIVVAIANAMAALNAAYVKCKIICINISDLTIQYQETADGVKRLLGEFGYAFYSGGSPDATKAEAPEMMLSQSTCSLERLLDPQTPNECRRSLNSSDLFIAANEKRSHLDTAYQFDDDTASGMTPGPLQRLVVDMHSVLVLNPRCHGTWVKFGRRDQCETLVVHDPFVWCDSFEEEIVAKLLRIVKQHKMEAIVALGATGSPTAVRAEQGVGPLKKCK